MIACALLAATVLAAPPASETTVAAGETTLAAVARRTLGDEAAASELRALNQLPSDAVRPGEKLRLPGPERSAALTALLSARSALARVESAQARSAVEGLLAAAQKHFEAARYQEAAVGADEVWRVAASGQAARPSSFEVAVDGAGATRVKTNDGEPVRIESEGVTHEVKQGEVAQASPGKPPHVAPVAPTLPAATQKPATAIATVQPATTVERPRNPPRRLAPVVRALSTPDNLSPANAAVLRVNRPRGTVLRWDPVEDADGYELTIKGQSATPLSKVLWVPSPPARVELPAGTYQWTVKARGGGRSSTPTPPRSFKVEREN